MNFYEELDKARIIVEDAIKDYLLNKNCHQKRIFEAMEYSIFTGGKRLRPIMAIKSCELFNKDIKGVLPYAVAIEMIHTYSLVHDDLPAMDDDDFRRGKPTNHKVFGEAMAILTGDGLLNMAFEIIGDDIVNSCSTMEDYRRCALAFKEISKYSGVHGMIGGQVVDLLGNHGNMNEDKLIFMYKTKTAALIQSALVSGAIIGGANEYEIESLRDFGLNLGLAYQIRDDILDKEDDTAIKKLTYLSFYDMNKAKIYVNEYSERAINAIKNLKNRDIEFFINLTEELITRKI